MEKVYVITWDDYQGRPGVYATLERALFDASKKGLTDFKEINPGVWKCGHWFIDECPIYPDFDNNPIKAIR